MFGRQAALLIAPWPPLRLPGWGHLVSEIGVLLALSSIALAVWLPSLPAGTPLPMREVAGIVIAPLVAWFGLRLLWHIGTKVVPTAWRRLHYYPRLCTHVGHTEEALRREMTHAQMLTQAWEALAPSLHAFRVVGAVAAAELPDILVQDRDEARLRQGDMLLIVDPISEEYLVTLEVVVPRHSKCRARIVHYGPNSATWLGLMHRCAVEHLVPNTAAVARLLPRTETEK